MIVESGGTHRSDCYLKMEIISFITIHFITESSNNVEVEICEKERIYAPKNESARQKRLTITSSNERIILKQKNCTHIKSGNDKAQIRFTALRSDDQWMEF